MLQEERVAVALNYFIEERENLTSIVDLDQFTATDEQEFLIQFKPETTMNNTDVALQSVTYWPNTGQETVEYLRSKLAFTIKHAVFRNKIAERDKSMQEVFDWYNEVNSVTLNYVTYSIQDSDISNFYRFIIGYKNLLRSVEYAGKSGILGMEYVAGRTNGTWTTQKFEKFVEFDVLRREYLNQTFNFLPKTRAAYDGIAEVANFDEAQERVKNRELFVRELGVVIEYFVRFLKYTNKLRDIIQNIADDIKVYVDQETLKLGQQSIMPLIFIVILVCFIPICIIFTLNITSSMMRYSRLYNEKVDVYRSEKKKTEKLLASLLPPSIIKQMKRGHVPKPEVFDNATIFFCDIVSFTNIASESTAHQIIDFLNDLYSMFDQRIENYDVYKVETIGDAYMVASGGANPKGPQILKAQIQWVNRLNRPN